MSDIKQSDLEAKITEWRRKAASLDDVAEILTVEDQHHESRANEETIRRMRSMAVAYRECAASAETLTIQF